MTIATDRMMLALAAGILVTSPANASAQSITDWEIIGEISIKQQRLRNYEEPDGSGSVATERVFYKMFAGSDLSEFDQSVFKNLVKSCAEGPQTEISETIIQGQQARILRFDCRRMKKIGNASTHIASYWFEGKALSNKSVTFYRQPTEGDAKMAMQFLTSPVTEFE